MRSPPWPGRPLPPTGPSAPSPNRSATNTTSANTAPPPTTAKNSVGPCPNQSRDRKGAVAPRALLKPHLHRPSLKAHPPRDAPHLHFELALTEHFPSARQFHRQRLPPIVPRHLHPHPLA